MLRSRAFFSQPPVGGPQALRRLWQTAGVTERPTKLGRAGWGSSLQQASGRCFQDTYLQPFRAPGTVCEGITSSLGLWRPGRACTLLTGQLLAAGLLLLCHTQCGPQKSPRDGGRTSLFSTAGPPPSSTSQPPAPPFPKASTPFLLCFPITERPPPFQKWGEHCSSVTKSCLTLCDPMDCSTPGFPVLQALPDFAQIHVHVHCDDAIPPSHPLPLPSPFAFSLSGVFSSGSVLHTRWSKYWSFRLSISPSNEYSGLISFKIDRLDLLAGVNIVS